MWSVEMFIVQAITAQARNCANSARDVKEALSLKKNSSRDYHITKEQLEERLKQRLNCFKLLFMFLSVETIMSLGQFRRKKKSLTLSLISLI
jgi:hypothetical protein